MNLKTTDCKKCGKAMKPVPESKDSSPINQMKMIVTGYLCDCGHWNNLKSRKPKSANLTKK